MKTLNTYLIRSVLPLYFIQYALMYWTDISDPHKWYVYDFGNALLRVLFISYLFFLFYFQTFNYERQVNYRTIKAVLVFETYNFVGEALNINQKGNLFEVLFAVVLVLCLTYQFRKK